MIRVRPIAWRALVTAVILVLLLWVLPMEALWSAIGRISPLVWLIAVVGFLAGHVVAAWKWRSLVSACGVKFSAGEGLQAHAAGLFANLCLPSLVGGDVVRAGMVVRRHGQLEVVALGSLVDRVTDTIALALLAGAGGLTLTGSLDHVAATVLVVTAVVLPLGVVTVGAAVLFIPAARLPSKLASVASRLGGAIRSLGRHPRAAVLALLLSLGIQSGFVCVNILIGKAMGIDIATGAWFLAWPLAKIIALVPVSLGGIGVREVALAGLLAPFGVVAVDAVAQSLSWEVVLVGSGILAGIFVFVSRAAAQAEGLP